ncbi:MAG: glycosyltransferase [Streptosporangiaceae bacterium]
MDVPHASISIICVFNDLAVRQACLDRSLQALAHEANNVEYLPIDNSGSKYASAGAALNHGAQLAKNDVLVFAHQDVYLHSLVKLKEAAGQLASGNFGVLGAVGVRHDGRIAGRIRDRVVLLGDAVTSPTEVDSVDEVLFLAARDRLLADPLTESPDLAWHAYAVEYGLRVRRRGARTGVTDIPLTHNSLTINLDRLDAAHREIASRYGEILPVRTTCGPISEQRISAGKSPFLASQRWRYRWLTESIVLRRGARAFGRCPCVLIDIRRAVDDIIQIAPDRELYIVNCCPDSTPLGGPPTLRLKRRDGKIAISCADAPAIPATLAAQPPGSWTLLTNLTEADLRAISHQLTAAEIILGFHTGIGFWLLAGAAAGALPTSWRSGKAAPVGSRILAGRRMAISPAAGLVI